jgi:hypothetical protein
MRQVTFALFILAGCSRLVAGAGEEMESLRRKFPPGGGATVVAIDPDARVVQFVEDRIVALDPENRKKEVGFLPARRVDKGILVSGWLAVRGDEKTKTQLKQATHALLGEGAKLEALSVESFRVRAFVGKQMVWERKKAAGNVGGIAIQFGLPDPEGGRKPDTVVVVIEQFVEVRLPAEARAEIAIDLEKTVELLRTKAKKGGGELTLRDVRSVIADAVNRGWVRAKERGVDKAVTASCKRILEHKLIELSLDDAMPEAKSDGRVYVLKQRIEKASVKIDLTTVTSLTERVASSVGLELRQR